MHDLLFYYWTWPAAASFQRYLPNATRIHARTSRAFLALYQDRKDVRFVAAVGDNLEHVIREGSSMLEHMNQDGMLRAFYEEIALCAGPTPRWLARIVAQISSRYPGINILEVGAGTGATTSAILGAIGDTYSSYTFTDVSSGFFMAAEERSGKHASRMMFKTFNMEKGLEDQGYTKGSYDVVVAVNMIHVSVDIEAALANIRRLLRPGGFLIVGELTSTDLLFTGMTWDSALKNTGFAGIDCVTPDISASLPLSVFVSQAIDVQITMLRNPLATEKHPEGLNTDSLAIIGGATHSVYKLSREVNEVLSYRFRNKWFFTNIEEFASSDMVKAANATEITVLSLNDLDEPYLENLTEGPINTVETEYSTLTAQTYDLDPSTGIENNTALDLAQMLLRQLTLRSWGRDDALMWTMEPQVFVSGGKQLITRLVPDTQKNDRYNSRRRDVFRTINPAEDTLELVGNGPDQARALELHKVSPLAHSQTPATQYRTVRIIYSLLQSIAVGVTGYHRLCVGVDVETSDVILALSSSSRSPASIPVQCCITLSEAPTASMLASVAANLIADQILSLSPEGATLLINEADSAVKSVLRTKVKAKSIKAVFTTAEREKGEKGKSIFLQPHSPRHVFRSLVPSSTAVFVHFSRGSQSDAVRDALSNYLPPACLKISEDALLNHEVKPFSKSNLVQARALEKAWDSARASCSPAVETIALEEVSDHTAVGEPLAILDWTANDAVTAKVQPVDSGILFRADRAYLFAKGYPEFVEDMERQYGAVIKTVALDITSRESLRSVYDTITATLPDVGGVVHGAMILDDEIFTNMSYDQFDRVAKPKVLGVQLLNELFYDNVSLEFFICCSSISSIIGWSGQSNYVAANDYMSSMMCNRRKRGVAGSSISIPAVLGIGYAAHSDAFDFDYIESIGYINIGEEDLHILFAEAVISGRPGQSPDVKAQVAMGVNYVPADLNVRKAHKRDVRFGHFVLREDGNGEAEAHGGKAGVCVKVQLQSAKSDDEAYAIGRDAFLSHLKRLLRTSEEEKVSDSLTLMEQGVDSLVAVDIRLWFLKELQVDVPTLKILGGGTIADLVGTALDKMPGSKKEESVLAAKEIDDAEVETPELSTSSSPDSAGSPFLSLSQSQFSRHSSEPDLDLTSFPTVNDLEKIAVSIAVAEAKISDVPLAS
ncbi:KR domain-containing protein [Hypoxylon sp. NC1633]|nr:KR domain-containing protein [Hypoxylon sp. NC1633]